MASDVLAALEFDKEKINGKLILVKEMSGSDAHFVFSCLITKQVVKDNGALCLVTLHNDFTHYYNVGLKLGYNLKKLQESGVLESIDCLKIISDSTTNDEKTTVDLINDKSSLEHLFEVIKKSVSNLLANHSSVCIVIDDLTHLLSLDFSINDINMFMQLCRSLILENKECSLAVGVHIVSVHDKSCMLSELIAHMADVICMVSGLATGPSRDVTGTIKYLRPWENVGQAMSSRLTTMESYHYKVYDKGIKVFAPGSR